jgi:hypothetical protein
MLYLCPRFPGFETNREYTKKMGDGEQMRLQRREKRLQRKELRRTFQKRRSVLLIASRYNSSLPTHSPFLAMRKRHFQKRFLE